jgi:hypothetical protein
MTDPSPVDQPETPGAEIVQFRPRNSLSSKLTYAKAMAESALLPQQYRGKPANMLWAMEYAEMLGLAPMAAVTGIHVIEGRPTASAALISALVRRAGHRLRVSGSDQKATAEIVRADDPDYTFRSEWTIERAKQANLTGKDVWKKYPAAMLKARAITEVARDACEEALSGMRYTPEELGAEVDEEGAPTTTVEQIQPEPGLPVDWDAEIAKCDGDKKALGDLWKRAPKDSEARTKIQAAAAARNPVKPAEDEPITVDAELVEEPAPARTRRPNKIADAKSASVHLDEMLANSDFDTAEGLAINAPRVDISGILTSAVREILDVQAGEKIMLPEFGQIVADYISSHGYSVQSALDGDLPGEAA